MATIQCQRYCKLCERRTLHARETFSNGLGCLLTILTAGIFLPIFLVIKVAEALTGCWRCQACGRGRLT